MKTPTFLMMAGGLLLAAVVIFPMSPNQPPAPNMPEPTAELKALVTPVRDALKGKPDQAADMRAFFSAYQDVLKRDQAKRIKTTLAIVKFNEDAFTLRFQGIWKGDVDAPLRAVFKQTLGETPVPIDQKRDALLGALSALEWACATAN